MKTVVRLNNCIKLSSLTNGMTNTYFFVIFFHLCLDFNENNANQTHTSHAYKQGEKPLHQAVATSGTKYLAVILKCPDVPPRPNVPRSPLTLNVCESHKFA